MLVSIVTVFYNRANTVKDSINSLLKQSYRDIEIIAVNDGSTDNTLDELLSFNDRRIKVIDHENCGFVESIIKAIKASTGEIIAIHGSGDISFPDRILEQVNVLLNNDQIGVVGSFVKNVNQVLKTEHIYMPNLPKKEEVTDYLKKQNIFTHGEVMFRKKIYKESGGYRPFFKYSQDRDLWLRMSLITEFYIIPKILYIRYNFADGVSTDPKKLLMQRYFGEIGKQCIELRIKGKPDLIEKYGYYAPFFRERSKSLSKSILKYSFTFHLYDSIEEAILFVNHSISEHRNLTNLSVKLIYVLSRKYKWFYTLSIYFSKGVRRVRNIIKGKL